jgi:FG-GAP repeat
MKNQQTHITRFLIIVVMVLIGCHIGLTAGRTASASSANKPTSLLPSLRGEAAIEHLKQTGLYHSLAAALTAARYQIEERKVGGYQASNYPVTIDPTLTQQQKLVASDTEVGDLFGFSVAISGETIVVGAHSDDGAAGTGQGSAYIFVRSGEVWSQQQKLEASDAAALDLFGFSVAISGETVVVGAHSDDGAAAGNQGSAYVFVRSGGVWNQQQKLEASDADAQDGFGFSVAISGETVVVGARGDDGAAAGNQGSAYVFVRSGGVWSQQQKLEASDAAEGDQFGNSVAINGETVVVGARLDGFGDQGSAYVFVRSGGVWSQQQKLAVSDGAIFDGFGNSVAISGGTIVVGESEGGGAYVFAPANQPPDQTGRAY